MKSSFNQARGGTLFSIEKVGAIIAMTLLVATAGRPAFAAGNALWVGTNFDFVDDQPALGAAEILPNDLKKSGAPTPVTINENILNEAMGMAFSGGNLWVVTLDSTVFEFDQKQLKNLSREPTPTPAISITSGDFQFLLGCAFDQSGDLWIADSKANGVHEISKSQLAGGGNITTAVTIVSNSMSSPGFPAFDAKGNLWVSSVGNNSIVEFAAGDLGNSGSPTPAVILTGPDVNGPGQMAFDKKGTMWVANSGNNTIAGFTKGQLAASGSPDAAIVLSSTSDSIDVPWGMTLDPSGNLWAFNYLKGSVAKFARKQLKTSGSPTPQVVVSGLPLYSGELAFGTRSK